MVALVVVSATVTTVSLLLNEKIPSQSEASHILINNMNDGLKETNRQWKRNLDTKHRQHLSGGGKEAECKYQ